MGYKTAQKKASKSPSKIASVVENEVSAVKERKGCRHCDKGFDPDKVETILSNNKVKTTEDLEGKKPISCEDCRERKDRGCKGKGTDGKNEGGVSGGSKPESKEAIWVCFECGHFVCGGVASPDDSTCHAVRHHKRTRHHLFMKVENSKRRWCFGCSTFIPVKKTKGKDERKDVSDEFVKLIREQSSRLKSSLGHDGDVQFETKPEGAISISNSLDELKDYVVRGLTNVGNTCYFNSVTQNLLALGKLRDYFLNSDPSFGQLTISLKKHFADTRPEMNSNIPINPQTFFDSICDKYHQFKGHQQHDGHELLRCLLEGLCMEELNVVTEQQDSSRMEQLNVVTGHQDSPQTEQLNVVTGHQNSTFVDTVFGGRISSTIHYEGCGHSKTLYEPFLDLSLSVPTKKTPSKNSRPISRVKKTKLPPAKVDRAQGKVNKDSYQAPAQGVMIKLPASESQGLGIPGENDLISGNNNISFSQDPKDQVRNEALAESCQVSVLEREQNKKPHDSSGILKEEEVPLPVQNSEVTLEKEESTGANKRVRETEASTSNAGHGEEELHLDGMINNPEISLPDEVDDSDSPLSLESCLAHFIKQELLSDDNALSCEICENKLQCQGLKAKKQTEMSESVINEGDNHSLSEPPGGVSVLHNDTTDSSVQNCIKVENGRTSKLKSVEFKCDDASGIIGNNSGNEEGKDFKNMKAKRNATKKALIKEAPPILTIHLMRFIQDADYQLRKSDCHVDFQEIIDISPYMEPSCKDGDNFVYRLVGVVEHIGGTLIKGHYVAFVRGGEKTKGKSETEHASSQWYRASDENVKPVSFEEVRSSKAYILFYEKT